MSRLLDTRRESRREIRRKLDAMCNPSIERTQSTPLPRPTQEQTAMAMRIKQARENPGSLPFDPFRGHEPFPLDQLPRRPKA